MNKKYLIAGIVIILVLVAGYTARHQIKSMLGMSSQNPPVVQTTSASPTSKSSSASATSNNIYLTKTNATKGSYLTDFNGATLYVFDKDTNGVSNCYNSCALTWPVYTSGATAQSMFPANITVITRTDGSKQFAWKGMPLYYFSKDQKPGDIAGDGVGGVWHIVKI